MNIQLIEGEYNPKDAMELITKMIDIKIKYHENKISNIENEEDIKAREAKIKKLQNELYELRRVIGATPNGVKINAEININ